MTEALRAFFKDQAETFDAEVSEAIKVAGGDVVHALRITLIANAFLEEANEKLAEEITELKKHVSKGYTRKWPSKQSGMPGASAGKSTSDASTTAKKE